MYTRSEESGSVPDWKPMLLMWIPQFLYISLMGYFGFKLFGIQNISVPPTDIVKRTKKELKIPILCMTTSVLICKIGSILFISMALGQRESYDTSLKDFLKCKMQSEITESECQNVKNRQDYTGTIVNLAFMLFPGLLIYILPYQFGIGSTWKTMIGKLGNYLTTCSKKDGDGKTMSKSKILKKAYGKRNKLKRLGPDEHFSISISNQPDLYRLNKSMSCSEEISSTFIHALPR